MAQKRKNNVLVIGIGDVGNALIKALKKNYKVYTADKNTKPDPRLHDFAIMHICFSFDKNFIASCKKYIEIYNPKLTIINSTVAVGTTREIINKTGQKSVVHSPVIGDHNALYKGIKTFTKIIGATDKKNALLAAKHFRSIGLNTKIFNSPETTELAKLLLTTQFALNIAFHQEMERMCHKFGTDFAETINTAKHIYNNGYSKIRPNVIMPDLFPGKIRGSCLMQNIAILEKQYKSAFFQAIKNSNDKKE